jgi:hypothetical protein
METWTERRERAGETSTERGERRGLREEREQKRRGLREEKERDLDCELRVWEKEGEKAELWTCRHINGDLLPGCW